LPPLVALVAALCAGGVAAGSLLACGSEIRTETSGAGGAGSTGASASGGSAATGPHGCTVGFADCNGNPADGCEAAIETDGAHCGACEHDCLGAACKDGMCEPEVLASNLPYANRLALDEERVYWTSSDNRIQALPLGGGTPVVLADKQDGPWDIAADGAALYWTSTDANQVRSLALGGGAPAVLADAGNPLGIAVRKGALYFTDTYDKLSDQEHVVRIPLPGGAPQTIASTAGAWMVAADDQRAYWTDRASGAVWSAPVSGGDAAMMASILEPTDIEVDGEAVYVTGLEGTFRVPLGGGAPQVLAAGAGLGLAIDATHVFVGTADGRILRVPKVGGAAVALAKAELYPSDIAVSDQHVLWITRAKAGALLRTPK
jgi:hypothetical protein